MNCKIARSLIQDYHEQRLVQLERSEFLRHIDECPACERELIAYRDVFAFMRTMEPFDTPRGFQNAIISQLKSEGVVYEPRVSPVRKWSEKLVALPGIAKYPLAAVIVIAALYLPLKLALGLIGGAAGRAAVLATDVLVSVQDTVGSVSFLARLWDTLEGYARIAQTVLGACLSLVTSFGENLWFLGPIVVVVVSAAFLLTRFLKKRSSQGAPFSL